MKREIGALTGLRGVAALWVLAFHAARLLPDWARAPFSTGYAGVDLFFVLSGYVLAYRYSESDASYVTYLRARFARIYPVHVATLGLFAATAGATITLGLQWQYGYPLGAHELALTLLLVNAWIPTNWNGPSWSLSAEVLAYISFPLILVASKAIKRASVAALVIVLLYAILALSYQMDPITKWRAIERIGAGFVAGVLLFRAQSLSGASAPRMLPYLCAVVLALGTVIPPLAGFLPLACCGVVYALATQQTGIATSLNTERAKYLGRISYALYLCHMTVIFAAEAFLDSPTSRMAAFPCVILLSLLLAHVLYSRVEQPCQAWLVGRSNWQVKHAYPRGNGASGNVKLDV